MSNYYQPTDQMNPQQGVQMSGTQHSYAPPGQNTDQQQPNMAHSQAQMPMPQTQPNQPGLLSSFQGMMKAPQKSEVFQGAATGAEMTVDNVGTFNGGAYRISHRDSNSLLTITLAQGCPLSVKPGSVLAMETSVTLMGTISASLKKMMMGASTTTTCTGPGDILLAPHMLGDISVLRLTEADGKAWRVGANCLLACTQSVVKSVARQNLAKAMFSGEGFFVYNVSGSGLVFMCSFGAIIRKELAVGEKYFVDNGYLVAWNMDYVMERVASGGILSGLVSSEGLMCKFTGPGTVYFQTRSLLAFGATLGMARAA